ncbi:MAG: hypothetical protein NT065_05315 [Chlamydiae bacterium]|nr:hypothetical protein [Chlamydiota bacterium]
MNICFPWLQRPSTLQEFAPAQTPFETVAVNPRTVDVNARAVACAALRDAERMRQAFTPRELRADSLSTSTRSNSSESTSSPRTPPPIEARTRPSDSAAVSRPIPIPYRTPAGGKFRGEDGSTFKEGNVFHYLTRVEHAAKSDGSNPESYKDYTHLQNQLVERGEYKPCQLNSYKM